MTVKTEVRPGDSVAHVLVSEPTSLILLPVCLAATYLLGRYLPGSTAFLTGSKLYTPANYVYDQTTVFDDSFLTWGSDYFLAITHGSLCVMILRVKETPEISTMRLAAAFLVGSFAISTFAGAISHQFLPGKLHTWYYRLVWRICVGSVGAAGGALGLCASELAKFPLSKGAKTQFMPKIPVLPSFFWVIWGVFFFFVVWSGAYSMMNPACDIFLTGVTQAPPTIYCAFVLINRSSWSEYAKGNRAAKLLMIGLLSNCLLLPGYDLMNALRIRDAYCNIMLHSVLFCSWTSQAIALRSFIMGRARAAEHKSN